jgi:NAD(P)-dependent dehydrogenase (short-subunit alcohol dehydrogenase family)
MEPSSESTKLEGARGFVEYAAAGKLKGKKALITVGDSGIGRAIAICYAKEGADSTIVYLPEEEEDAHKTKKLVEKEGKTCLLFQGDLMDNKNCEKAVAAHVEKFGGLDILINNASKQVLCKDFAEMNLDNVESTFKSNVLQTFAMTKFATPHLKEGSS